MTRTSPVIPFAPFILLAFVLPDSGGRQSPGSIPDASPDSAADLSGRTMVFEREVFVYPATRRRNPFLPAGISAAPGSGDVRLLGIIHHPDSAYRLVILGIRGGVGGADDSNDAASLQQGGWTTRRLRSGGVLERMRIAEIHVDHIVVATDAPDGIATRVLALPRPMAARGS